MVSAIAGHLVGLLAGEAALAVVFLDIGSGDDLIVLAKPGQRALHEALPGAFRGRQG